MLPLLKANIRHILRAKLFFMLILFSFIVHYLGLKVMHHMTISIQNSLLSIGTREAIFTSLFFQLFIGAFLSAVYGIWMVPYAHQGSRSFLTFTLPVPKWKFPLAYSLSFLGLIIIEHLVMFISFGMVFGFKAYLDAKFPWAGISLCLLLETIAFETVMLGFALSSMHFGQIPTFFLGLISFFVLQVVGTIIRSPFGNFMDQEGSSYYWVQKVYKILPPVGELVFDLKHGFAKSFQDYDRFVLWGIWYLIFILLFRIKLRYPSRTSGAEA